jgi:hypothetical protein
METWLTMPNILTGILTLGVIFLAAMAFLLVAIYQLVAATQRIVSDSQRTIAEVHLLVNSRMARVEAEVRDLRARLETAQLVAAHTETIRQNLATEAAKAAARQAPEGSATPGDPHVS